MFDTPTAHGEHDLVAVIGESVFIVESKASAFKEPSRDPDRARSRIEQAFRAETGIQYAFEQGARVRRRLDAGESVALYNERGDVVAVLDPAKLPNRYCVVVTRDNFGGLVTDLTDLFGEANGRTVPVGNEYLRSTDARCDVGALPLGS